MTVSNLTTNWYNIIHIEPRQFITMCFMHKQQIHEVENINFKTSKALSINKVHLLQQILQIYYCRYIIYKHLSGQSQQTVSTVHTRGRKVIREYLMRKSSLEQYRHTPLSKNISTHHTDASFAASTSYIRKQCVAGILIMRINQV